MSDNSVVMLKKILTLCFILFMAANATSVNEIYIKAKCYFGECCHPNDGTEWFIRYQSGTESLLNELKTKVYGQPLITEPIYKSLKAHMANESPSRPLIMYFSGWTGTGKTHVAKLIASSLFKKGMESEYVRYISSVYHFPVKIEGTREEIRQQQKLRDMIKETVSKCPRSLIILDELDKLPPGVVDGIQPLLDYVHNLDGVKYNKAIFIFLSNTGAEKLNQLSYKMFREGKERKDLSRKDIEEILILESYNEKGGLGGSSILKRYSIGVFVPFLPLDRQHVRRCIKDAIEKQNVIPNDEAALIEEIADEMTYFPNDTKLYSKSGCKGVEEKVYNFAAQPIDPPKTLGNKKIDL